MISNAFLSGVTCRMVARCKATQCDAKFSNAFRGLVLFRSVRLGAAKRSFSPCCLVSRRRAPLRRVKFSEAFPSDAKQSLVAWSSVEQCKV